MRAAEFNRKVAFGTVESKQNANNGSIHKIFVEQFSVWCAPKLRTLNQQYQIQGTALDNTKVIVVRHNTAVEGIKVAQIDGVMYDVVQYSPDESNAIIAYDFVTLKRRAYGMAEQSLEDILNAFIEDAEALSTNMTVEDKAKVTKAGADVFAKELEAEYKANHYRNRTTGKDPHLADSVIAQSSNVDGMKNGSSTVGFSKDKAYIANFIENGTKFPMYTAKGRKYKKGGQVAINGDHAIDNLRNDSQLQAKVVEAQAEIYKQIINRRNNQ